MYDKNICCEEDVEDAILTFHHFYRTANLCVGKTYEELSKDRIEFAQTLKERRRKRSLYN
jgi:hypothetical protein